MAINKKNEHRVEPEAVATGGGAGALAGAGVGALAGGPAGAAVGAVIGGIGGALGGTAVDDYRDDDFRTYHESSAFADKYKYEEAAPAYRYGFESYGKPEYQGKSYKDVSSHLKSSWAGSGDYKQHEPLVRAAYERRHQIQLNSAGEAVVPVVEEEVRVGKRKVEKGGVKVATHVTETPVEETVHLHEEKVKVERRPVNRAVTSADAAFQEGTIELTESAEEAVVDKKARVVEEVVVKKTGHERSETVRDTVRRTDVDVEHTDAPAKATKTATTKVATAKGGTHAGIGSGFESHADVFRTHHSTAFKSGHSYEQVEPAYRYGYDLATDKKYAGKDWKTVEADAKKHWSADDQGPWQDFKDAVHHAWMKVRGEA